MNNILWTAGATVAVVSVATSETPGCCLILLWLGNRPVVSQGLLRRHGDDGYWGFWRRWMVVRTLDPDFATETAEVVVVRDVNRS